MRARDHWSRRNTCFRSFSLCGIPWFSTPALFPLSPALPCAHALHAYGVTFAPDFSEDWASQPIVGQMGGKKDSTTETRSFMTELTLASSPPSRVLLQRPFSQCDYLITSIHFDPNVRLERFSMWILICNNNCHHNYISLFCWKINRQRFITQKLDNSKFNDHLQTKKKIQMFERFI